jgi:hypothetical protein
MPLRTFLLLAFDRKNLAEITRHDISQKLEKLKAIPSEQNHALVAAKIFFKWAVRNGYIDQSPCESFSLRKTAPTPWWPKPFASKRRERANARLTPRSEGRAIGFASFALAKPGLARRCVL